MCRKDEIDQSVEMWRNELNMLPYQDLLMFWAEEVAWSSVRRIKAVQISYSILVFGGSDSTYAVRHTYLVTELYLIGFYHDDIGDMLGIMLSAGRSEYPVPLTNPLSGMEINRCLLRPSETQVVFERGNPNSSGRGQFSASFQIKRSDGDSPACITNDSGWQHLSCASG